MFKVVSLRNVWCLLWLASLLAGFSLEFLGARSAVFAAEGSEASLAQTFSGNWEFEPGTDESARRLKAPAGKSFDLRHAEKLTVYGTLTRGTRVSVRLRWTLMSRVGGLYASASATIVPVTNQAAEASVELAPEKGQMLPVGHQRPWDALAAAEITSIEVHAEVYGEAKEKTLAVELKDPHLDDPSTGNVLKSVTPNATQVISAKKVEAPRVLDLRIVRAPQGMDAQVALCFRLEPLPENPFPSSASPDSPGDVRVKLPNSEESLAFLDQDFFDLNDGTAMRSASIGLPYYKAYLTNWPNKGDVQIIADKQVFKIAVDKVTVPMWLNREKSEPSRNQVAQEPLPRWAPALEVPIYPSVDKAEVGLWNQAPKGWTLVGKDWKPTPPNYAPDAQAWRPVLFWNAGWGQFGGTMRPDFSLARRMDQVLADAAQSNKQLPLLLIDGEPYVRQGMFNWFTNPLNAAEGGTLSGPGQIFRSKEGQDFCLRSARYAVARWGRCKAVNSFLLNLTINAPGAEALHARFAEAAAYWTGLNGKPLVSTHPLGQEPEITARIGGFNKKETDNLADHAIKMPTNWITGDPQPASLGKTMLDSRNPATDVPVLASEASSEPEVPVLELGSGANNTSVCVIKPFMLPSVDWAQPAPDNFYTSDALMFEVWLPADAPTDLRAGIHLRDKDQLWYQTLLPGLLRAGDWTTCVCDLTGTNAQKLEGIDHLKTWTSYSRERITEVGLHLYSTHAEKPIKARIARVRGVKYEGNRAPTGPAIQYDTLTNGQPDVPPTQLKKGELWEAHLQLAKTYENPFDPCQVDLAAVVTTPSGKTVRINGFFDQACKRSEGPPIDGKPGAEIVEPVGRERWTIRFRVQEEGAHQVKFEVREGGQYKTTKSEMVSDTRFTPEGQPYQPVIHNENDWYYEYEKRSPNGKRKLERLKWEPGAVAYTWEPAGEKKPLFTAQATDPAKPWHGFLRKSTDNKHLEFDDGTPYFALGMCVRSPADYRLPYDDPRFNIPEIDRLSKRGTYQYDEYFNKFKEAGMNWARVWMCSWWGSLTWRRDWPGYQGYDRYNLLNAWRDDYVMNEAEKRGIYLSLCLTNHGQYSRVIDTEWKNNPYTTFYGGPLTSPAEFFSLGMPQLHHMNYLRYCMARWGHTPAVMAFDLISEFEWLDEYRPYCRAIYTHQEDLPAPILQEWHEEMAGFLKDNDPNKHLVATHVSRPIHGTHVLSLPCIDLAASNAYSAYQEIGGAKDGAPRALDEFYNGNNFGNGFFKGGFAAYNKPVLVEEQGRHWMGCEIKNGSKAVHNTKDQLDADLHGTLWGSMVLPMVGATGYWWTLHVHYDDKYSEYQALGNFMKGEDFRANSAKKETLLESRMPAVDPPVTPSQEGLVARALQSTKRAYVWVYQAKYAVRTKGIPPIPKGTLRVNHLEPGKYTIEFWDTHKGVALNKLTQNTIDDPNQSDPKESGLAVLEIELPKIVDDIALKIKRAE